MAGIFDFLFGSKDKLERVPALNQQQNSALSQVLQNLGVLGGPGGAYEGAQSYLSDLLNPEGEAYDRFSAPYLREFNEQTLPGIAERYAGAGALSSSGFGQSLGAAGAGLSERLAALRGQLMQQGASGAFNQYNQLANQGLGTKSFGFQQRQGTPGFLGQVAGNVAQNATWGGLKGFGQDVASGFGSLRNSIGFGG